MKPKNYVLIKVVMPVSTIALTIYKCERFIEQLVFYINGHRQVRIIKLLQWYRVLYDTAAETREGEEEEEGGGGRYVFQSSGQLLQV